MKVGNRVRFVKQSCGSTTPIMLGSIGVLSDYTDEDKLNCYVVFNQIEFADWFNEDELEDLGEVL